MEVFAKSGGNYCSIILVPDKIIEKTGYNARSRLADIAMDGTPIIAETICRSCGLR